MTTSEALSRHKFKRCMSFGVPGMIGFLKYIMDRRFISGFLVGGLALAAVWFWADRSSSNSQVSNEAGQTGTATPLEGTSHTQTNSIPNNWLPEARALTMPGNREYALPLNNPDTVLSFAADHVNDEDLVVGVSIFGHHRAYPWWIMSNFHVVNDTLVISTTSKIPLMVALCEQCSGSAAFIPTLPELPERPLTFQICGIHDGTFEIADFQTHSRWHPFSGEATEGPLKGKRLIQISSIITRWGSWKKQHPDTDVALGSVGMRNRPHGLSHGASMGHKHMHPVFWASANQEDERLPANKLVFGLLGDDDLKPLAVELDAIQSTIPMELTHGDTPIILLPAGDFGVRAYAATLEETVLTFQLESKEPLRIRDQEGRLWDENGKCQAETNSETSLQLKQRRGYVTEWYEWVSAQPNSDVFVRP